jgi:hypothetical protein
MLIQQKGGVKKMEKTEGYEKKIGREIARNLQEFCSIHVKKLYFSERSDGYHILARVPLSDIPKEYTPVVEMVRKAIEKLPPELRKYVTDEIDVIRETGLIIIRVTNKRVSDLNSVNEKY